MATRWWRIKVTANNGDTYARIGTIEMRGAIGGANLCVGGVVLFTTQFSVSGDNSAAAAFDAFPNTAWAGQMILVPAIGYQFAAPQDIAQLAITCRADSFGPAGAPKDFTVQTSADGSAWTDLWHVSGQTAWAQGETRLFSNPALAATALSRTATGLLYRDTFDRPDGAIGADYTIVNGTWAISGGRLRHVIEKGITRNMRLAVTAMAARAKMHVQASLQRDDVRSFLALTARDTGAAYYYAQHNASDAGGGQANAVSINRVPPNTGIALVAGAAATNGVAERFTFFTDAGVQKAWLNGGNLLTTADVTAANQVDGTAGFQTFGNGGLPGNTVGWIDDFTVCSDRTITVNGLPAGYKIRANGLTSAAAVAATPLVLDLLGTFLPVTLLEVLDGANAVVDSTKIDVWGGDVFTYDSSRVLRATLPVKIGLVGAMVTGRTLSAVLPVRVGLLGRLAVSRILTATLPVRPGLLGRMVVRDRWQRSDGDPASNWTTPDIKRRFDIGLGPATPLAYNALVNNAKATYGSVEVSYDAVWKNPPLANRTLVDSIQQYGGFGGPGGIPLIVRFNRPVREFGVLMQQMDYYGGYMSAHDANGVEIGRVLFDLAAFVAFGITYNYGGFLNATLPRSIDMGQNVIREMRLMCDNLDWVVWTDLYFTVNGVGAPWAEHEVAPATAWSMN